MRIMMRAVCLALAVGTAAAALSAEEALGLEELRARALERSESLASALLAEDAAALQERLRAQELLPSLSARAGGGLSYSAVGQPATSLSLSLSASQPLWDGGRHRIEAAIDALSSRETRNAAREAYLAVLGEVDAAYYAVLKAEASVAAAESDLAAAALRLELGRAKFEAGILSRTELLAIESEAASKETALNQTRKGRAVARARLASLAGTGFGVSLREPEAAKVDDLARRLAALGEAEVEALALRLVGRTVANSPSLAAARTAAERAGLETELARRQNRPTISASYAHSFELGSGQELDAGSGSISLSGSLAFAPWNARVEVEAAVLAERRAGLAAAESERTLELGIRESLYALESACRSLRSSTLSLELAERRYEGSLELWKRAATSSSELSDAAALVSSSRTSLISARFEILGLLAELRTRTGVESDAYLLEELR